MSSTNTANNTANANPNADLLGDPEEFAPRLRPVLSGAPDAQSAHITVAPTPGLTPGAVMVLPPDPAKMGEKFLKMHTQNRIRQCFHALAVQNLAWVQEQLHRVAQDSPAKAVELFIDLAKFSLPQLKETAVTVTQNNQTRTFRSSEEILNELNAPPEE